MACVAVRWFWITVIVFCYRIAVLPEARTNSRSKRNLWQFRSLVNCLNDIGCMAFNNYGCWCGKGHTGRGKTLDDIDECCKEHDLCYKAARAKGCTLFKHPKLVLYDYVLDCDRGMILCTDPAQSCDLQVCQCDRQASFCFARHAATYNPLLKDLNSRDKQRLCNS